LQPAVVEGGGEDELACVLDALEGDGGRFGEGGF
jgi:hypothetical protein